MASRTRVTFETVQEVGLGLPGVETETTRGALALTVRGKMFACRAVNKSAEPDSLWVRLSFEQRDELIAADPATYYVTDHYINYRGVLVRLSRLHPDALSDLLGMAWRFVSAGDTHSARSERSRRRHPGHV